MYLNVNTSVPMVCFFLRAVIHAMHRATILRAETQRMLVCPVYDSSIRSYISIQKQPTDKRTSVTHTAPTHIQRK